MTEETELQKYKAVANVAQEMRDYLAHGFECSRRLYKDGCICGLEGIVDKFDTAVDALNWKAME